MTSEEYKAWLQGKLDEHKIDRTRLVATVIVLERSLGIELDRSGSRRERPYYKLYNEDGTVTRAWVHAAELALWLKYSDFKVSPYVHAIVHHPFVKRFVANKKQKRQIPMSVLFPAARADTQRLKEYTKYLRNYFVKH